MRKFALYIFVAMIMSMTLVSFSNVRIVSAQGTAQGYTPLAPIPGLNDTNNGQTDVNTFIPTAVRYIIAIAGALAVIMIVIGGVQYASSDAIQGKSDGKGKIENAIYGLILILASFVILQTINPNILKLDLNLSTPSSSSSVSGGGTLPPTTGPNSGTFSPPLPLNTSAGSAWPPTSIANSTVANDLAGLGLPITTRICTDASVCAVGKPEPDCQSVGQNGCISLDGLSDTAINGLSALSEMAQAQGVAANIVITGGTEYWEHCVDPVTGKPFTPPCPDPSSTSTDHKPGMGAVDISSNSTALDGMISSQGNKIGSSVSTNHCESTGRNVYSLNGATYVQETDNSQLGYHWHVCYGP